MEAGERWRGLSFPPTQRSLRRVRACPRCSLHPPTSAPLMPGPLEIFREALALFRRAGLSWFDARVPAYYAALSVASSENQREEWAVVLSQTATEWMRCYERQPSPLAGLLLGDPRGPRTDPGVTVNGG